MYECKYMSLGDMVIMREKTHGQGKLVERERSIRETILNGELWYYIK